MSGPYKYPGRGIPSIKVVKKSKHARLLWFDHTTVTLVLCFLIFNLYEAGNQFDQCLDFPAKNSHYHMCIKTTAARRTTERTLQGETKQVRVGYFLYIYDIFLKFWFIYPYISEKIQFYYDGFYGKNLESLFKR